MREYPEISQGSSEWLALRLGIPTASNFHKILTRKTRKISAQASDYIYEKCAEWLLGQPIESAASGFMDRGTGMQPEATAWYEATNGVDVRHVGFVTLDDGSAGCSPDGLVGDDGGLEIKCPGVVRHVENLLTDATDEYALQVQGCLWITGRKWWDIVSYHPSLRCRVVRVERDEGWIDDIETAVGEFNARVREAKERLLAMGCKPREPKPIIERNEDAES